MKFIAFPLAFATFLALTMQQDAAASPASSRYCEEEEPMQGDVKLTDFSLKANPSGASEQLRTWKKQPYFLSPTGDFEETPMEVQATRPLEDPAEATEQEERKQKYAQALHDIATLDATLFYEEDENAKKMVDEHPSFWSYGDYLSRGNDFAARSLRGKDYARAFEEGEIIPSGAYNYPRQIAKGMISTLHEQVDKDRWNAELDRLDKDPKTFANHYYAMIADIRKEVVMKQHAALTKERAAREAKEKERAAREEEERRLAQARERLALAALCIFGGFVLAYAFYRLLKHLYTRYPSVKAYFRDLCRPHPATIVACALLIIPCIEQEIKDGRDGYYYFGFLRVAICSYAIIAAIQYYKKNTLNLRTLLAAAIAILYNPAFPVTRAKYGEDWMQINIPSALLIYLILRLKLPTKTPSGDA